MRFRSTKSGEPPCIRPSSMCSPGLVESFVLVPENRNVEREKTHGANLMGAKTGRIVQGKLAMCEGLQERQRHQLDIALRSRPSVAAPLTIHLTLYIMAIALKAMNWALREP